MKGGGEVRESGAGVGDGDDGERGGGGDGEQRRLGDNSNGAELDRLGDELRAVDIYAGVRDEESAGSDLARFVGDANDFDVAFILDLV